MTHIIILYIIFCMRFSLPAVERKWVCWSRIKITWTPHWSDPSTGFRPGPAAPYMCNFCNQELREGLGAAHREYGTLTQHKSQSPQETRTQRIRILNPLDFRFYSINNIPLIFLLDTTINTLWFKLKSNSNSSYHVVRHPSTNH